MCFSESSQELNINIGKADITVETGLAARFLVSQLPTLYHISGDGTAFRKYSGKRRLDDLETFLKKKQWQEIEPTVWYMQPNSLPMNAMSSIANVSTH